MTDDSPAWEACAQCPQSGMVFVMVPRRRLLQAPLLLAAERAGAATHEMTLSITKLLPPARGIGSHSKVGLRRASAMSSLPPRCWMIT